MRRLYFRIYLSFVAILALFAALTAIAWWIHAGDHDHRRFVDGASAIAAEVLPPPGAPRAEVRAALERLAGRLGIDLAVFAPNGSPVARAGDALAAPDPHRRESGWMHGRGGRGAFALRLDDGRWVVARDPRGRGGRWPWILGLLLVAIALGAYPLARRITGRLERLRSRVDALGAGDLSARVAVEGRDEIAELARSFNRAAERIERLVDAQRTMLASASHELRTPLGRIRMAIELLGSGDRPELRRRVERDVAELDALIEELLLASRLETEEGARVAPEPVDLLALVAEEGARVDAQISGEAAVVAGEPRLLRHLVRNLLDNARRHGGDRIEARVEITGALARLAVEDDGRGVPETERERVFEPFYRPGAAAETGEGVGLGLHLVRRIARRHGGDARCVATASGARFETDLPLATPEPE